MQTLGNYSRSFCECNILQTMNTDLLHLFACCFTDGLTDGLFCWQLAIWREGTGEDSSVKLGSKAFLLLQIFLVVFVYRHFDDSAKH
jgi:hypothetical protein